MAGSKVVAAAEKEDAQEQREEEAEDSAEASESLPELLDLIDAAEAAAEDEAGLAEVLRDIGRRIRATPGDRDLLSDFEGIPQICRALAGPPHCWRGGAMLAFCGIMPDVCRTSAVNRGALRDEGFLDAVLALLRTSVDASDATASQAAAASLAALCTASDGNKRAASQVAPAADADAEAPGGTSDGDGGSAGGAMPLLLEVLARFPDDVGLQAEGMSALRAVLSDDDPRKADCEPAALANRELALSDGGFPFFAAAVERALSTAAAGAANCEADGGAGSSPAAKFKLQEQALLVLRELARRQDAIQALAMGAKLLPKCLEAVDAQDARLVRAGLAVLRSFVFDEEVRDELALMSDGARRCVSAVRRCVATPAVCEQGFGLLANLTMRKSMIAEKISDDEAAVVVLGLSVMKKHGERPDVAKSVTLTLRNMAAQVDAVAEELRARDVFPFLRALVLEREGSAKWHGAVETARQLLREFHEDEGVMKKAVYNAYY